jgi:hypothetical protein
MAERNISINRDNQILLNKLVEISNGKWNSVGTADMARQLSKKSQSQVRPSVRAGNGVFNSYSGAGTNINTRKKETERIERENHKFAKRLFDKGSQINKKTMDQSF